MNIELQPRIADFRIATALDSFLFFWVLGVGVFLLGLFLTFSAFWGRSLGCFFLFRPTASLNAGAGLGDQTALLWHRTRFLTCWAVFGVVFLFRPAYTPVAGSRGRSGYFGYSDCGTELCHFLFSLFWWSL